MMKDQSVLKMKRQEKSINKIKWNHGPVSVEERFQIFKNIPLPSDVAGETNEAAIAYFIKTCLPIGTGVKNKKESWTRARAIRKRHTKWMNPPEQKTDFDHAKDFELDCRMLEGTIRDALLLLNMSVEVTIDVKKRQRPGMDDKLEEKIAGMLNGRPCHFI